ncbi:MAG TPA: ABC transporter ATP-binding protein [Thermoanaerobaculia bacterium]|nr:ABC transporter ATP-binding protein [Thermoanaerobaculia bacterium]HQR68330.1 ABC transporter ATP-binding protein [Thermoanaerobaculia bacterium]
MIELERLSRTYVVGDRPVHALRDVTLALPGGDYASVMGPSGSGKSTLLNVLGCLDRPDSGSYRLDGREVARLSEAERTLLRRHRIGFVFQTFHLVPRLTALGNVELPMVFAGVERGERDARARKALDAVGLTPRAEHRPEQLSGGERQRVALARAVVMGPSILLADEPTGNLDTASGGEIVRLLESMNAGGLTLVVVTHDPAIGGRARHRVRLVDGAVAEEAGP